ncbi:hypothetical protein [Rasiella sp. SM2506]|uniref:hypothetical protein n=1 Tax=Rasiella sp. SM2506 TaxID=3423914 RepID=UPI003D797B34
MESQTPAQLISRLETPVWFSITPYMEQDLAFIKQLLTAPIFKQNVPNMFERFTKYLTQIDKVSKRVATFSNEVKIFKESLENYSKEDTLSIDDFYYERQKHFTKDYIKLSTIFLELKSDVFTYLSGALLTKKTP